MIQEAMNKRLIPYLREHGYEPQKKDLNDAWPFLKEGKPRSRSIEISQGIQDEHLIGMQAYVEGYYPGKPGIEFVRFDSEDELEQILDGFVEKLDKELLPKMEEEAKRPYYQPSEELSEKILNEYRECADKLREQTNIDDGEPDTREAIRRLENWLRDKRKQSELPNEDDICMACSYLIERLDRDFEFKLSLDSGGRGPLIDQVSGKDETLHLPLGAVVWFWNEMDREESLLPVMYETISEQHD